MQRTLLAIVLTMTGAACSRGDQKLFVINDTGQPVEIEVDGTKMNSNASELAVFSDLKLTKAPRLVAMRAGQPIDSVDLPAVPEDQYVIWLIRGSDKMHVADYQALANIGRKEVRLFAPSRDEIALIEPLPPARFVTIPSRSVVVGPSAPLPAGGKVTLGGEKLPIIRIERVPEGVTDVRAYLAEKAGKEITRAPK